MPASPPARQPDRKAVHEGLRYQAALGTGTADPYPWRVSNPISHYIVLKCSKSNIYLRKAMHARIQDWTAYPYLWKSAPARSRGF